MTAEMYAIYRSLLYIKNQTSEKFVIFCDSQSAIYSVANSKNKNAMQIRINKLLNKISNKSIILEWIPSHVGIEGNEAADSAAKSALEEDYLIRLPLNIDELKCIIKKKINAEWQKEYFISNNRYYKIKPKLMDYKSAYRDDRREEVVLSRLRTGNCLYLVQHYFTGDRP